MQKSTDDGQIQAPDTASNAGEGVAEEQHPGTTRRRFTRASLGVAPVVLALMHRPALAQTVCASPSGFESANLSNRPNETLCNGGTPSFWLNTSTNWPAPYLRYDESMDKMPPKTNRMQNVEAWDYKVSGGTRIVDAFPGYAMGLSQYGNRDLTMMQLMLLQANQGSDRYRLGCHLVAALLNAAMGWTEVLSEADVIKIWNDHYSGGGFQPTGAAQPWSEEKIMMYLQSTMTRN